jgi:hypothetical protein
MKLSHHQQKPFLILKDYTLKTQSNKRVGGMIQPLESSAVGTDDKSVTDPLKLYKDKSMIDNTVHVSARPTMLDGTVH